MKFLRILMLTMVSWLFVVAVAAAKQGGTVGPNCWVHMYEPEIPESLK